MNVRKRIGRLAPLVGAVTAVALGCGLVSLAAAETKTEPAHSFTLVATNGTDCAYYGALRWRAISGVTSYTVLFDDPALGGPQSVVVSKPWPDDHKQEGDLSAVKTPGGTHQLVWTGLFGCGETPDFSWRFVHPRVKYTVKGEFIDGTVTGDCRPAPCDPIDGVRVTARGPSGGSDTTDKRGDYSIKVKEGTYVVAPDFVNLKFDPPDRRVRVSKDATARANFTANGFDPRAVATVASLKAKPGHLARAEYFRNGKWEKLGSSTQLRVGDKVRTDENTEAAFEFAVGGRVGIRPGGTAEIVGEASSTDDSPRLKLTKGQMWAKCQNLKEPLEIQTGGGVIGIKG